jgi:hypothetical protein
MHVLSRSCMASPFSWSRCRLVPKFHVAPNASRAALPILTSKFLPTAVLPALSEFVHNAALQIQIQNPFWIQNLFISSATYSEQLASYLPTFFLTLQSLTLPAILLYLKDDWSLPGNHRRLLLLLFLLLLLLSLFFKVSIFLVLYWFRHSFLPGSFQKWSSWNSLPDISSHTTLTATRLFQ